MSGRKDKRILIVAEENTTRRLLRNFCKTAGYSTDCVSDNRAAWTLMSSISSAYLLIFLDTHVFDFAGSGALDMLSISNAVRRFIVIVSNGLDERKRAAFLKHKNVLSVIEFPPGVDDVAAAILAAESEDQ